MSVPKFLELLELIVVLYHRRSLIASLFARFFTSDFLAFTHGTLLDLPNTDVLF